MLRIRVNSRAVRHDIDLLEKRVRNARPFMRSTARKLYGKIKEVFDTEGYRTWPPLSEPYASEKLAYVGYKTILRYSDRYYRAATSNTEDSIFNLTSTRLEIGVKHENFPDHYPLAHEEGRPQQGLPARPVYGYIDVDAEELVEDMERYLFERIEGANIPRRTRTLPTTGDIPF